MDKNKTRMTAVVGTTMALVIVGTAAVAAAGPRDDRGFGHGKAGMGANFGEMMQGARGMGGMRGLDADFERVETTIQTADELTTRRIEQGVADAADAASLSFSLADGETVTVAIDEDTNIVAFEEQEFTRRGWSRTRMAPTEVEAADIEVGAEIVVWSDADDDADFVASRIVIQPVEEAEAVEADADEAVAESDTVEAVATDA